MVYYKLDDDETTKLRRFPGSHLSSPLVYYPQRLIIQHYEDCTRAPIERLRAGVRALEFVDQRWGACHYTEDPSKVYVTLFNSCCLKSSPYEKEDTSLVQEITEMLVSCTEETKLNLNSLRQKHPALESLRFDIPSRQIREVALALREAYKCYKYTTDVRSSVQLQEMTGNNGEMYGPFSFRRLELYHQGETLICKFKNGEISEAAVMNYDQWVMLCDTVVSRFITLLVCELNAKCPYDILPSPVLLRDLYTWGDKMLNKVGMSAYAVIGEFESIVTSRFVSFSEEDPLNLGKEFVESIFETAAETESEYGVPQSWTLDLMQILKGQTSVNILSEVFGLRKHWGNPMVEATASGRAVQEKLNEDLPIDGLALVELEAALKRMLTIAFIKKHSRWPNCHFESKEGTDMYPLKMAKEKGNLMIPETHPRHKHLDWALLEFDCNVVLDTYENQLDMLSDKSVSFPVSELDYVYYKGLKGDYNRPETTSERRLILKFLQKDQLSVMEILNIVMSNEIPAEWLANAAAMKGTEVKHLKARIFAVLTFELRQYFAVTEDMIKKHIFPYNPHQTMTMNESELLARLRGMTKQMDVDSTSRTLNVMHIVDFSKWNLRMRYENTAQVFKVIDDFLGMPNLVERSHHIFEDMVNLVQDAYNPPVDSVANTSSDTIWRHHSRGWEGQRQKGWTLLTSALLSDIERITGIHSEICGQGDNQILLTMFPIPEQYPNAQAWMKSEPSVVKEILDNYYRCLENKCSGVGLKVKTAETCRSLYFMNYGKRLFFNGVELSMTLKRISKAMTESNDAFPLTEVRLKTSQGASYAAGLYSHPSPWPFFMSRFCTMIAVWESFNCNPLIGRFGKSYLESKSCNGTKFYSILNKIPSSLGGPSQQPFAAFLCRGHPDPLCEDLVLLCLNAKSGCQISKSIIECALEGHWFTAEDDQPDKASLILSPYSLSLKIPLSARSPVARAVLPALISFCRNSSVTGLLSLEVSAHEKELLEALSTLQPFNPVVANDIFSRSVVGERQTFINGLKNATSICRLVQDSVTNPIVDEIKELERKQLMYWVDAVDLVYRKRFTCGDLIPEHQVLADALREISWRVPLTGVTVPHPLETFKLVAAETDLCEDHQDVLHNEHIVLVKHNDNLFSTGGRDSLKPQLMRSRTGNPYLGNVIAEGITSKQVICKNPSKSFSDACKLNVLRQWISNDGEKLDEIMRNIIASRTDANLDLLNKVTGRPSRLSYVHRAAMKETKKSCAITATSNMYTRIYTSSNRMGKYSTNDVNFHLPYGPAYLSFSFLLCLEEVLKQNKDLDFSPPFQIYHCHMDTEEVPIVFDGDLEVDQASSSCVYPLEPPSLLHTSVENLSFEDLSVDKNLIRFSDWEDAPVRDCRIAYAQLLMGDLFVREIVKKELLSSSMVDMYAGKEMNISIGDMRLTNVSHLVRAFAINFCFVMGFHRAIIEDKSCFVYSVIDFMRGLSPGFWDHFSNAMGKPELIGKLRSLTDSGDFCYDGANLQTLASSWESAVALEMYKIKTGLQDVLINDRKTPFVLVVPNLSAARHLYSKYVELCVWVFGSSMCLSEKKLIKMGRDISNLVHSKETFLECVLAVMQSLLTGCLTELKLAGRERLFSIRVYNLNDPWIDRLRDVSFSSSTPRRLTMPRRPKADHTSSPEIAFTTTGSEQSYRYQECLCNQIEQPFVYNVEGFFIRSGPLDVDCNVIVSTLDRYELDFRNTVLINDQLGTVAKVLASNDNCELIYLSPCRDITEYAPHLAGTYLPPELIGFSEISKITMPAPSALIGNLLKSEHSRYLFEKHISKNSWCGVIVRLPVDAACAAYPDVEDSVVIIRELCERVSTARWLLVVGEFGCNHKLSLVGSILSTLFETIVFNRTPFTQSETKGAFVGFRRRFSTREHKAGHRLINIEQKFHRKAAAARGGVWRLPLISYMSRELQRSWILSMGSQEPTYRLACDRYLPGLGTDSERLTVHEVLERLAIMSTYHRNNMEEIHRIATKFRSHLRGGPRSHILNVSIGGTNRTMEEQMGYRIRCIILQDLLKSRSQSIVSILEDLKVSLSKRYTVTMQGEKFVSTMPVKEFLDQLSLPLFCILGFLLGHVPVGVISKGPGLNHFKTKRPRICELIDLPPQLKLINESIQYSEQPPQHESRAKLLALLIARQKLTKDITPSPSLTQLALVLAKAGYISVKEELSSASPNVYWYDQGESYYTQVVRDISRVAGETEAVIVVARHELMIKLVERFFCDFATRVPWMGNSPGVLLCRFFQKRKSALELAGKSFDINSTVEVLYRGNETTECGCYDCATEDQILRHFGINESVLSILYDSRIMETLTDHLALV